MGAVIVKATARVQHRLVELLEEDGFEVRRGVTIETIEERSRWPQATIEIAELFLEHIDDLGVAAAAVMEYLRARKLSVTEVILYGPDGEVLKRVRRRDASD